MNYEVEINKINARLDNLQESFIQAQKNQVPITAKTDDTANKVAVITPYTESKTAGIQDTVCVFDGHYQHGVISAMVVTDRGALVPNTIEWSDDNITVRFEELKETATVTISIQ